MHVVPNTLKAALITLATACGADPDPPLAGDPAPTSPTRDSPPRENPLSVHHSGLSVLPAMCPDWSAVPLEPGLSLDLTRRVFRDQGYSLEQDVQYDREGISVRLDGWDAERRTGFVLLSGTNLEHSAFKFWGIRYQEGMFQDVPIVPPLKDRVARALAMDEGPERQRVLDRLADLHRLLTRGEQAFRTSMQSRYALDLEGLEARVEEVAVQKDPERCVLLLEQLLEEAEASHQGRRLSLEEYAALEGLAIEHGEFIAVISCQDPRFKYPYPGGQVYQRVKDPIGQLLAIDDLDEYRRMRWHWLGQLKIRAMERMEEAVRGYLAWTTTLGG